MSETEPAVPKRHDTQPELSLARELRRRGLTFRTHFRVVAGLRREADVAFPDAKLAVFVDGCFWHGCPEHFYVRSQSAAMTSGVLANRARDADTTMRFTSAGWRALRFWEHVPASEAADLIEEALESGRVG